MVTKELKDLKKGDTIYIEYGFDIHKAKVISNDPENERIFLNLVFMKLFWIIPFYSKCVKHYNEYNFENYKLLNK